MDAPWPATWPKMAEELHVFDPRGDVLLILERRPEQDLVEVVDDVTVDEVAVEEWSSPTNWGRRPPPPAPSPPPGMYRVPDEPSPPEVDDGPSIEPEPLVLSEPEAREPVAESEMQNYLPRPESPASSASFGSLWGKKQKTQEVQMRVSSKHLILASSTFCTSLGSDTFPEGRTLQAEGSVVVPLPDEDPDAMTILMHIIHGRKAPRHVSLETLTEVAVVVNHRQMHEVVEFFSDTWIENLKPLANLIPSSPTPEVLKWLFVFWVFRKKDEFRKASQLLERESDDSLEDEADAGPPIPTSIITAIQDIRIEGIEGMITVIHDLITKYAGQETVCQGDGAFACDAILLGSLLKHSTAFGIWPQPKDPYSGITFETLVDQIRGMQVLDGCNQSRGGRYYNGTPPVGHRIKDSIEASIRSLEERMCGLSLRSFLPKRDKKIRSNWEFS